MEGISHIEEASKPSTDIDMEQLPDVESSQTEINHVLQEGDGRNNNRLEVDDNDRKGKQASTYKQRERAKPDMYAYISRKAVKLIAQVLKRHCIPTPKMSKNKQLIKS